MLLLRFINLLCTYFLDVSIRMNIYYNALCLFHLTLGYQLSVFNGQSTIQVGGRWNKSKGRVEKPFLGIISGLVVNGARILELATQDQIVISIRGDVQALPPGSLIDRTSPLQRMQQVFVRNNVQILF